MDGWLWGQGAKLSMLLYTQDWSRQQRRQLDTACRTRVLPAPGSLPDAPTPHPHQAGMVALLPATDPSVWRIRGGNGRLAPAVLRAANATVRCPAAVTAVRRLEDGRFQLELASQQGQAAEQGGEVQQGEEPAAGQLGVEGPFDAVIVAAPLEGSGISLDGLPDKPLIPARKYQKVRRIADAQGCMDVEGAQVGWTSCRQPGVPAQPYAAQSARRLHCLAPCRTCAGGDHGRQGSCAAKLLWAD